MVTGIFVDGSLLFRTSFSSDAGFFFGFVVLGEALNACQGDLSWGEANALYLLHGLPYCLLDSLGGSVPDRSEWSFMEPYVEYPNRTTWKYTAEAFIEWTSKWPAKGKAVLLGYAADGHPMYSPYDEDGNFIPWGNTSLGTCDEERLTNHDFNGCVMAKAGYSISTPLDHCNGMMVSLPNGKQEYRYYLTATPPFMPVCLVGDFSVSFPWNPSQPHVYNF